MPKIAIVIPAYKSKYFEETLNSIANQSCKDFTLYIGDDNSPENLEGIVSKFHDRFDIVYKKFETNLGSTDLISQWNRCVQLVRDEEYIWLFSDDDLMPSTSVEQVLSYIAEDRYSSDVYHINCKIIDSDGNKITRKSTINFYGYLSPEDYVNSFLSHKGNTWGINFIVKKTKFVETGGFVNFDLAWNSDHASWLKFCTPKGLKNIPNTYLFWRLSNDNISSFSNIAIIERKVSARLEFYKWLSFFMKENNLKYKISIFTIFYNLLKVMVNDPALTLKQRIKVFFISFKYLSKV